MFDLHSMIADPDVPDHLDPVPDAEFGAPAGPDPASPPLARVVYLGFDACDASIVSELAAAGELPTFARVLETGASVSTLAPGGVFPSAVWPTFATALTPDHHRYYSWSEVEAGSYRTRDTDPSEIGGTGFFESLSRRGRRLAVLDIPHTRPVEGLNGVMISEWGCHDRHGATASWPPELLAEVEERIGAHPVGCDEGPGFAQFDPSDYLHRRGDRRTAAELEQLFADLCEGHERKRALSLSLLDQGGWDLFAAVFSEGHCTGHQLWHVHDRTHPWHETEHRDRLGSPIVEMYRRLDATLAAHLERLGPETTAFVHLSHGMGPHYDGTDLLEHVLRLIDDPSGTGAGAEPGVACGPDADPSSVASNLDADAEIDRPSGTGTGTGTGIGSRRRRLVEVLDRVDPALRSLPVRTLARVPAAQRAWRRWLERQPRRTFDPLPPESVQESDRSGKRWFAIPNNTITGAVRLNVVGREPNGIVEPGVEFDAMCQELSGALAELVNIDTGEPLVLGVTRGDAVHEFTDDDPFPDVLVEWNRSAPIERVWSPRFGAVEVPRTHWRTGDHTPHGLFVAVGPGIEPGSLAGPVGVQDLAPTVCAALGEALPDVDGRPIASMVPDRSMLAPDQEWSVPCRDDGSRSASRPVSALDRIGGALAAAARQHARTWLELPDLDRRVSDVEGSLGLLSTGQLEALGSAMWATDLAGDAQSAAHAAQTYAEFVNNSLEVVAEALGDLRLQVGGVAGAADVGNADLEARTGQLFRLAQIDTTMRWIEMVDQPEGLLITVIMPTHNRASLLNRSIGSVMAQEFGNWELLVVDDGSTDDTAAVLDGFDDPRIQRFRSDHVGCSAARNVALAEAAGDAIVYLDDDNVMHRCWLKSVAWAFSQRADVDVLIGARVVDDDVRVHDGRDSGGAPWIQFEPFDRDRLERGNTADVGVIAHRSGLAEMHFDEELVVYGDWDLLLRLTRDKAPLELAAIAIAYATDTPERLSIQDQTADHDHVQAKLHTSTPTPAPGSASTFATGSAPQPRR